MILYENTVGKFIESCLNKKMFSYLIEEYERHYGKCSPITYDEFKICIYELMLFIMNDNVNNDCGIRIDFINNERNSRLSVIFASENNNNINIGLLDMFSFTSIKPTGNKIAVLVESNFNKEEILAINPFMQSLAYIKYLIKNEFDDNCEYYITPFLYDCLRDDSSNIFGKENNYELYFAGEYLQIVDRLKPVINCGNGIKALQYLHSKDDLPFVYNEESNDSYELIAYQINEDQKVNRNAIYLVKAYSDVSFNETELEYIDDHNISVIINDFSCDKIDINGSTLFFYFELSDKDKETLIKYASNNNLLIREIDTTLYSNYEEDLNGLAKIIEKTNDGTLASLNIISNYDIIIVDNEKDCINVPDYARIVISNDTHYDEEKQNIVNGDILYNALVKSFINGDKGAYVYVANKEVREYIKTEIEKIEIESKNFKQITEVVKNGGNIDDVINSINTQTKDNAEKIIENNLGDDCWSKMYEDSKTSLVTGLLVLEGLKKCDKTADFSGSCLQLCKAVEFELTDRYVTKYIDYLKEKYGDKALEKAPYDLLKEQKNKDAPKEFIDPSRVTLGNFSYIMGLYTNGKISNKYAWNEFEDYAKNKLLKDTTDPLAVMSEHIYYITKIKNDYRNKSAHKDFMDVTQGNDCYNYIVGKLKKLAVILDAYNY